MALILFVAVHASAQQLLSFVGGTTKGSKTEVSWSMGEIAIQTLQGQKYVATQGVQQPNFKGKVEEEPEREVGIFNGIDLQEDKAFKVILSDESDVFYNLYVINRWGELLDERQDARGQGGEIEWDLDNFQQRTGQSLPNGTYYFILQLKTGRGTQAKITKTIKEPFYILSKR